MKADLASIGDCLEWAKRIIGQSESRLLLGDVLKCSRATLIAFPERPVVAEAALAFVQRVERRAQGEPIAYLVGSREFYGREFLVAPGVLIPRPETEHLIELAKNWFPQEGVFNALDLGTGSGALAITLGLEFPHAEVIGVDQSQVALDIAMRNREHLCPRVTLLHSDWFSALTDERFDLIVANPPYIAAGDRHLDEGDVRFEPREALVSGEDGLNDIRRILMNACTYLRSNGYLVFEHGYDQAVAVRRLMLEHGFVEVASELDLAGIERATYGRMPT